MGVVFSYTPPKDNIALRVHLTVEAAETAAAHALLDASQPLVPVEERILKDSGRVIRDDTGAAVTYGRDDDGTETHAPSNQYAAIVHEDLEANHPNGGQAKFLEKPMHSAHEAVLAAGAAELKRAFE